MATNQFERIGSAGLRGWRGKVGDAVARPVARRSRFSESQVRSVVGIAFLALSVLYFVRTTKEAMDRTR